LIWRRRFNLDDPTAKLTMKIRLLCVLAFTILCAFNSQVSIADAQGTAFTYQGRLNDGVSGANGTYDLTFALYDSSNAGTQVGVTITNSSTVVSNGSFSVLLNFGDQFPGTNRWLAMAVRTNGAAAFTTLTPRQALTPTPYAIHAGTASDVGAGSVVKSLNNLRDSLTLQAGNNVTITPTGNTLTIAAANGGGSSIWSQVNNNAYYTTGNVGIGTSGPLAPLEVNGITRSTRSSVNGQYVQLDGGDPTAIRLTAQSVVSAEKTLLIQNLSGESTPGANNSMQFVLGTSNAPSSKMTLTKDGNLILPLAGSGGTVVFGTPNFESGLTFTAPNRADIRYDGSTLKLLAGTGSGIPSSTNGITIATSGNVGIGGSFTPVAKLEVVGQDALRLIGYQPFLTLLDANAGYARARMQCAGGDLNLFTESYMSGSNPFSFIKLANNGNVGIGSTAPVGKLEVVAQDALRLIGYQPFLTLYDNNSGYARGRIQSVGGSIVFEPESYLNGSNPNNYVTIANSGNVSVKNITIRGGADVAEPFDVSEEKVAAGSVVIIDDEHPGKLKVSSSAYDTRVAGIISGANGVNPGISLHQDGMLEGSQNVALSGRVYVQADAGYGAIKPGDLLTTSQTPGYAMKVSNSRRAQGAILGKAMSGLKAGKGMVLVLVTLQ
jgi:hypothetical protein